MSTDFAQWLLAHDGSAYNSLQIASDEPDEDFESWFGSNGGYLHPSVELTSGLAEGNGMRVKEGQDLLSGSMIVSCPHDLTLSWASARKYHFPTIHSTLLSHVASRLFVMKQYLLREHSPWWPYIKSLPQPADKDALRTPMYYDAEDLVWIRGTNLEHARKVCGDTWYKEYTDALHHLFGKRDRDEERKLWTWELYLWACTIMTSRCFPGPAVFDQKENHLPTHDHDDGRSPVLIPGVDLLNHNPSSRVAWLWDSTICAIKNDEAVPAGSQVPNNYGPKGNAELIMGYGFSLPNNPADHFSIAFSPAISAYIRDTKVLRRTLHPDSEPRIGLSTSDRDMAAIMNIEDTVDGSVYSSDSADILITEDSVEREIHWVRLTKDGYDFSPNFARDLSIAVENARERQLKASMQLASRTNFWDAPLSRNKLHVMCATVMMLQKGQAAIREYDGEVPEQPKNAKQVDAARYRQSQLQILGHVLEPLYKSLSSYIGISEDGDTRYHQLIRLESTLEGLPKTLLKDYRRLLYAGMKTRDPRKIRERGGADFAFTVWLCGLWIYVQQGGGTYEDGVASGSAFKGHLLSWLHFLQESYPEAANGTGAAEQGASDWFDPIRNSASSRDATRGEPSFVAASYLNAIEAVVAKHPQSVYNHPRITASRLEWCLNIVRMEGVWYPDLQGGTQVEDDEWILFMETLRHIAS